MSLTHKKIDEIFKRLREKTPNPTTELKYDSTFELLISVILSAQATDISVNRATRDLYQKAKTPQEMYDLGVENIKNYIKTIGLFNTKADNIFKTCYILIHKYNGQIPSTRKDLESLPGVGRKTANVVLNTAFNQPTIAIDTHIFRIANRTKMAPGKTPLAVENQLLKKIPKPYLKNAHHWLILHGRYICKAQKPLCDQCIIEDLCLKQM